MRVGRRAEGACQVHASRDEVVERLSGLQKVGFCYLTSTNAIFSPQSVFNINCVGLSNYTVHYDALINDLKAFDKSGYTTLVCMGDEQSARSLRDNLIGEDVGCSYVEDIDGRRAGIFILPIEISKGFAYPKAKVAVLGREDVTRTRKSVETKKTRVFTMPKVGDYVVHEIHGIGKCLGTKYIQMGNINSEYVVVEYKNAELLYVPTDKLDRLSRYNGSDRQPRLSAIGGKEFEKVKQSVKSSIKRWLSIFWNFIPPVKQAGIQSIPKTIIYKRNLRTLFLTSRQTTRLRP